MTDRQKFAADFSAGCEIIREHLRRMEPGQRFMAASMARKIEADREETRRMLRYLHRQNEVISLANGQFQVIDKAGD